MKKTVIKGHVLNFAQEDLRKLIPEHTIEHIKMKDADPLFKAFAVAHEGEAKPSIAGTSQSIVLKHFKNAVIKLSDAMGFGTPAFYRHTGNDGTGNNDHRERIGELVGKTVREIGGKLHAIAAFYIYPKFKTKELNAASYEADVSMVMDEEGGVRVDDVGRVTGVALSDMDRPAFPGATLMATMQAFVDEETVRKNGRQRRSVQMSENISLADVKAFIRSGSFSPEEFFSLAQLREVRDVKNTYEKAERVEAENKTLQEKIKTMETTHTEALKTANTKVVTAQASEILKAVVGERKLSPQLLAHAQKNFKAFQSQATDAEGLKKDMQTFIDNQANDLDETLKGLNLKPEEHGGTGWKPKEETAEEKAAREAAAASGTGGAGSGDGAAAAASAGDLTDPKKNDMIPPDPEAAK